MSERIPEVRNSSLGDLVDLASGGKLEVWALDPRTDDGALSSENHIIDGVIEDIFTRLRLPQDRSLELLCAAVGRASVKRIFNMPEVRVYFGDYFNPTSVLDIKLRSSEPEYKEIKATEATLEANQQ